MGIHLSDWVENIVGKEEIACCNHIFFFHNVFKSCLLLMHQNEYLWSKGLTNCTLGLDLYAYQPFFACDRTDQDQLAYIMRNDACVCTNLTLTQMSNFRLFQTERVCRQHLSN